MVLKRLGGLAGSPIQVGPLRLLLLPCRRRWWFPSDTNGGEIAGNLNVPQVTPQAMREILLVATYGEIRATAKEEDTEEEEEEEVTCAVCLSEIRQRDRVWELRNCYHVFHKACLDRWLDHHDQMTCPLCRAPLISTAAAEGGRSPLTEPSWAVEQLLYLFSDDLLFSSTMAY
ncbi:hypothetical protein IEQ34_019832 [Dendrobium chrysotoxum]|uniref:RING-type domain-containing protein n=1 Tax=Dendrobium chrysotoxum TaxID=161865 RepID=A0AAV7GA29_DENCH|nr:hypothetical protein IEQ34_019832 [Dendrobium chrysotoxum]